MSIPKAYRTDCEERYDAIKESADFNGKSLIDIGCANGYFIERFLADGGVKAVGVEPDEQYKANYIVRSINDVSGHFDICFYLDLHYHNGINYFNWIKEHADVLYVAPSGSGRNKDLECDLSDFFGNFQFILNTAYANRNIYKVIINAVN